MNTIDIMQLLLERDVVISNKATKRFMTAYTYGEDFFVVYAESNSNTKPLYHGSNFDEALKVLNGEAE